MKRFLLRLALFLVLLFLLDQIFGIVMPRLMAHAKGGNTMRDNHVLDKTSEDILVFGSSRAIHHYNPFIIEDSTGLSCFVCGMDGMGIVHNIGLYGVLSERYAPKYVIYEITPSFDLLARDNLCNLTVLRPYCDRAGVKELFDRVDKTEKYKTLSNFYRYNSKWPRIVMDNIHPLNQDEKGFRPLQGTVNESVAPGEPAYSSGPLTFDTLRINLLNELADACQSRGTRLIFVISPSWNGFNPEGYRPMEKLCSERKLPLLVYANDPKYHHNNQYFKDSGHLNANGADEFTRDLMRDLHRLALLPCH